MERIASNQPYLNGMPFIFVFFSGRHPVRDSFVNNKHDQFDPEFFFVCFKHTEFGGECVLGCYHSVIFRSYVQQYLEKMIILYTECVRVCVLNFQIV